MKIVLILVFHWLADYVFQTTHMATRKHSSLKWLSLHILTYTVILTFCMLVLLDFQQALIYGAINGLFHFGTDFVTSKLTYYYRDRARVFYPLLGLDQLLHMTALILTFEHF